MKHFRKLLVAALVMLAVAFSAFAQNQKTIFAYVGAGIKAPVIELAEMFKKETGIAVEMTFNNSGALVSQLTLSRKGDVFMPGSMVFVEKAASAGLVDKVSASIAYHVPVIIVPKANPAGIRSIGDFAKPGVKLVLPDSRATALGKSAFKIFDKIDIRAAVEKNILSFGETPQKVAAAISMGTGDAGIVDYSNVSKMRDRLATVDIDPMVNAVEVLPCAVLSCTADKGAAERFMRFAEKRGPAVFEKHGFKTKL